MNLRMNEHGEFVDDYDPYGVERRWIYREAPRVREPRTCVDCGCDISHLRAEMIRCPRCNYEIEKRRRKRR